MITHLRDPLETDIDFLFNSWLKSYRHSNECNAMNNEVFFKRFGKIITKILGDSTIIVACNPDDQDQIYGYLAYKTLDDVFVLHYIYVKYPYRKLGIAKKMLDTVTDLSKPMVATFANRWVDAMRGKLLITFDPYIR